MLIEVRTLTDEQVFLSTDAVAMIRSSPTGGSIVYVIGSDEPLTVTLHVLELAGTIMQLDHTGAAGAMGGVTRNPVLPGIQNLTPARR